jgi:predicted homoserine dehydrogenase-like protein
MAVVVDLDVGLARQSFKRVGWADGRYDARSAGEAIKNGTTFVTDDLQAMLACEEIECVSRPPAIRSRARVTRSLASSTANTSSW